MREDFMGNEKLAGDAIEAWLSQKVEPIVMSIAEIQQQSRKFEGRIRLRNLTETVAGVIVLVVFGYYLFRFPTPMQRAGSLLTIAGTLFVMYRVNGMAAPGKAPADGEFENCVAFHRRELERQRDLLLAIWRWYLGPLVPGVLLFSVAVIAPKVRHPADWWRAAPFLLIMVAWFWVVGVRNRKAAAKLQKKIDELGRVAQG